MLFGGLAALAVAALLLRAAATARSAAWRRAGLACAGAGVTVAGLLLFAALRGDRGPTVFITTDGSARRIHPWVVDPDLGAIYAPGLRVRAVKRVDARGRLRPPGGAPVYDATYTIDRLGNRVAPENPDRPAVVFFGCSYTFGDGIDDQQSLPWQFAEASGHRFDVVNAGHSGHGAHQMLRMLETDHLAARLPRGVARAFYSAMDHHPARAAGLAAWDLEGPRYELEGDGVAWRGPFLGHGPALLVKGAQSLFGSRWLPPWRDRPVDPPVDEERWVRIVSRAATLARERWGAPLTTIMWDANSAGGERMAALLRERGLDVLPVSSILPTGKGPADLIPDDWHPTPATNAHIARALAARFFAATDEVRGGSAKTGAPETAPGADGGAPTAGAGKPD
jgi:hypothetical protein